MDDERGSDEAAAGAPAGADGEAADREGRVGEGRVGEGRVGEGINGAGADDEGAAAQGTNGNGADEEPLAPWLSDDAILLAVAAVACLLAAATAHTTDQFAPVVWFAVLAVAAAAIGVAVDVATDYVAGTPVHLLVGAAALVGAVIAVTGRHWANVATLGAAAALVLWRVVDVEVRDAAR